MNRAYGSARTGESWADIDIRSEGIVVNGPFYVAMRGLEAPGQCGDEAQFLGMDLTKPVEASWVKPGNLKWFPIKYFGGGKFGDRNAMIRVSLVRDPPSMASTQERPVFAAPGLRGRDLWQRLDGFGRVRYIGKGRRYGDGGDDNSRHADVLRHQVCYHCN